MVSQPISDRLETKVSVLTWNLWWQFGPWEQRQKAIVKTLKNVDADILCLQEVWDDGTRNLAAELATELGFHFVYAPGAKPNGVFMGNAILSRWPILRHEIKQLHDPKGDEESRVVLFAEVDGPRGKLPIFSTHLHWQMHHSHIRQKQIAEITDFIRTTKPWKFPPVLGGDFNADPHSEEIRMVTGQTTCPTKNLVFHDAWDFANPGQLGFTWDNQNPYVATGFEPNRRIDFLFVGWPRGRGAGHIVDCQIVGNSAVDDVQPSDHYALLASLRY